MADFSQEYKALMESKFGEHLIERLTDLHDGLIREAEHAKNMEASYGFTMEASGVIKTIEHLKSQAVVLQTERVEQ